MKVSNGLCHSARNGEKIYEKHRLAEVASTKENVATESSMGEKTEFQQPQNPADYMVLPSYDKGADSVKKPIRGSDKVRTKRRCIALEDSSDESDNGRPHHQPRGCVWVRRDNTCGGLTTGNEDGSTADQ